MFYEIFLFCSFCFDLCMYFVSLQDEELYILYNKSTGNYLKHDDDDDDATSELNFQSHFYINMIVTFVKSKIQHVSLAEKKKLTLN